MNAPAAKTILVLDDDEIILVALKETLSSLGHNVHTVSEPQQALELLRKHTCAVIISDQRMPEMTGLEFFAEAKRIQPNASRILITGVLNLKTIIDAVNKGEIFRFLAKPWIREELLATVNNAIQRFQLLEINRKLQEDTLKLNEQLAQTNHDLQERIRQLNTQQNELQEAHTALDRNFQQSIELFDRILASFCPILGQQAKAITHICEQMADAGNLGDEEQRTLEVAAPLQNIGLIGVHREIIYKMLRCPETLEDEEQQAIHNHPAHGETLANFGHKLRQVGAVIRAHHERWDGKGYPDGLSGESIPHPARLLAVAVYYVECGLPRQEAMEAILENSGKAFDPEAVRLFLKATQQAQLPRQVREVLLDELRPGLTLAAAIHSPTGLLLVPQNETLSESTVRRIKQHDEAVGFHDRLLVYL